MAPQYAICRARSALLPEEAAGPPVAAESVERGEVHVVHGGASRGNGGEEAGGVDDRGIGETAGAAREHDRKRRRGGPAAVAAVGAGVVGARNGERGPNGPHMC